MLYEIHRLETFHMCCNKNCLLMCIYFVDIFMLFFFILVLLLSKANFSFFYFYVKQKTIEYIKFSCIFPHFNIVDAPAHSTHSTVYKYIYGTHKLVMSSELCSTNRNFSIFFFIFYY